MKNLCLKICFFIAALFGSVSVGYAVPKCPKIIDGSNPIYFGVDECFGVSIYNVETLRAKFKGKFRWRTVEDRVKISGKDGYQKLKKLGITFEDRYELNGWRTETIFDSETGGLRSYTGEWKLGFYHGFGTFEDFDGTIQRGIFQMGAFQYIRNGTSVYCNGLHLVLSPHDYDTKSFRI